MNVICLDIWESRVKDFGLWHRRYYAISFPLKELYYYSYTKSSLVRIPLLNAFVGNPIAPHCHMEASSLFILKIADGHNIIFKARDHACKERWIITLRNTIRSAKQHELIENGLVSAISWTRNDVFITL